MLKLWLVLLLGLLMVVLCYLIERTRWRTCSFPVGLWEMGYSVMGICSTILLFGGLAVARVNGRPRQRLMLLMLTLAGLQVGSLSYLVWGTKATILLMEKEENCVLLI